MNYEQYYFQSQYQPVGTMNVPGPVTTTEVPSSVAQETKSDVDKQKLLETVLQRLESGDLYALKDLKDTLGINYSYAFNGNCLKIDFSYYNQNYSFNFYNYSNFEEIIGSTSTSNAPTVSTVVSTPSVPTSTSNSTTTDFPTATSLVQTPVSNNISSRRVSTAPAVSTPSAPTTTDVVVATPSAPSNPTISDVAGNSINDAVPTPTNNVTYEETGTVPPKASNSVQNSPVSTAPAVSTPSAPTTTDVVVETPSAPSVETPSISSPEVTEPSDEEQVDREPHPTITWKPEYESEYLSWDDFINEIVDDFVGQAKSFQKYYPYNSINRNPLEYISIDENNNAVNDDRFAGIIKYYLDEVVKKAGDRYQERYIVQRFGLEEGDSVDEIKEKINKVFEEAGSYTINENGDYVLSARDFYMFFNESADAFGTNNYNMSSVKYLEDEYISAWELKEVTSNVVDFEIVTSINNYLIQMGGSQGGIWYSRFEDFIENNDIREFLNDDYVKPFIEALFRASGITEDDLNNRNVVNEKLLSLFEEMGGERYYYDKIDSNHILYTLYQKGALVQNTYSEADIYTLHASDENINEYFNITTDEKGNKTYTIKAGKEGIMTFADVRKKIAGTANENYDSAFASYSMTEQEAIAQGYTIIKSAADLEKIRQNPSGKFCLMANIDMSELSSWTPIGDKETPFSGELFGNGFIISNINQTDGVFNCVENATIKYLILKDTQDTQNSGKDYFINYSLGNLTREGVYEFLSDNYDFTIELMQNTAEQLGYEKTGNMPPYDSSNSAGLYYNPKDGEYYMWDPTEQRFMQTDISSLPDTMVASISYALNNGYNFVGGSPYYYEKDGKYYHPVDYRITYGSAYHIDVKVEEISFEEVQEGLRDIFNRNGILYDENYLMSTDTYYPNKIVVNEIYNTEPTGLPEVEDGQTLHKSNVIKHGYYVEDPANDGYIIYYWNYESQQYDTMKVTKQRLESEDCDVADYMRKWGPEYPAAMGYYMTDCGLYYKDGKLYTFQSGFSHMENFTEVATAINPEDLSAMGSVSADNVAPEGPTTTGVSAATPSAPSVETPSISSPEVTEPSDEGQVDREPHPTITWKPEYESEYLSWDDFIAGKLESFKAGLNVKKEMDYDSMVFAVTYKQRNPLGYVTYDENDNIVINDTFISIMYEYFNVYREYSDIFFNNQIVSYFGFEKDDSKQDITDKVNKKFEELSNGNKNSDGYYIIPIEKYYLEMSQYNYDFNRVDVPRTFISLEELEYEYKENCYYEEVCNNVIDCNVDLDDITGYLSELGGHGITCTSRSDFERFSENILELRKESWIAPFIDALLKAAGVTDSDMQDLSIVNNKLLSFYDTIKEETGQEGKYLSPNSILYYIYKNDGFTQNTYSEADIYTSRLSEEEINKYFNVQTDEYGNKVYTIKPGMPNNSYGSDKYITSIDYLKANVNWVYLTEQEALSQGYTVIKSEADLEKIRQNPSGKFCLMCDIDMSKLSDWLPIGDQSTPFTGELNGNGFKITNLNQTEGLFGYVKDAKFSDLFLKDNETAQEPTKDYFIGVSAGDVTIERVAGVYNGNSNYQKELMEKTAAELGYVKPEGYISAYSNYDNTALYYDPKTNKYYIWDIAQGKFIESNTYDDTKEPYPDQIGAISSFALSRGYNYVNGYSMLEKDGVYYQVHFKDYVGTHYYIHIELEEISYEEAMQQCFPYAHWTENAQYIGSFRDYEPKNTGSEDTPIEVPPVSSESGTESMAPSKPNEIPSGGSTSEVTNSSSVNSPITSTSIAGSSTEGHLTTMDEYIDSIVASFVRQAKYLEEDGTKYNVISRNPLEWVSFDEKNNVIIDDRFVNIIKYYLEETIKSGGDRYKEKYVVQRFGLEAGDTADEIKAKINKVFGEIGAGEKDANGNYVVSARDYYLAFCDSAGYYNNYNFLSHSDMESELRDLNYYEEVCNNIVDFNMGMVSPSISNYLLEIGGGTRYHNTLKGNVVLWRSDFEKFLNKNNILELKEKESWTAPFVDALLKAAGVTDSDMQDLSIVNNKLLSFYDTIKQETGQGNFLSENSILYYIYKNDGFTQNTYSEADIYTSRLSEEEINKYFNVQTDEYGNKVYTIKPGLENNSTTSWSSSKYITTLEVLKANVNWAYLTEQEALSQGYTVIKSEADLEKIRQNPSGKFCLMCDIDMSKLSDWLPIGDQSTPFTGELNGNGFKITNLNQTEGLFGYVKDAKFSDLFLKDNETAQEPTKDYFIGVSAGDVTIERVAGVYNGNSNYQKELMEKTAAELGYVKPEGYISAYSNYDNAALYYDSKTNKYYIWDIAQGKFIESDTYDDTKEPYPDQIGAISSFALSRGYNYVNGYSMLEKDGVYYQVHFKEYVSTHYYIHIELEEISYEEAMQQCFPYAHWTENAQYIGSFRDYEPKNTGSEDTPIEVPPVSSESGTESMAPSKPNEIPSADEDATINTPVSGTQGGGTIPSYNECISEMEAAAEEQGLYKDSDSGLYISFDENGTYLNIWDPAKKEFVKFALFAKGENGDVENVFDSDGKAIERTEQTIYYEAILEAYEKGLNFTSGYPYVCEKDGIYYEYDKDNGVFVEKETYIPSYEECISEMEAAAEEQGLYKDSDSGLYISFDENGTSLNIWDPIKKEFVKFALFAKGENGDVENIFDSDGKAIERTEQTIYYEAILEAYKNGFNFTFGYPYICEKDGIYYEYDKDNGYFVKQAS